MLNKIKLALALLGAGAIISMSAVIGGMRLRIDELKNEVDINRNNSIAYESLYSGAISDGRVLRLRIQDLERSELRLIQKLDSIDKLKKVGSKKPGTIAAGSTTVISDSSKIGVRNDTPFRLDTVVVHNNQTRVGVKIDQDSLMTTLDINNNMYLFVYSSREYVNQYKNWIRRFLRFDFKKTDVLRYKVENDNDLIKISDFIIYKIEE